jgi:hypothetical protein
MNFRTSEKQLLIITTSIHNFISKLKLTHVCRHVVLPPTQDENMFKVLLYLNKEELSQYKSLRDEQFELDEIVNRVWENIYNFFDIPVSVFIVRVSSC